MNLSNLLTEELLARVEKPSRYLGTEHNAVHKADVRVRLALAFPDLYDLGLGNLGIHILYAILNELDGIAAERADELVDRGAEDRVAAEDLGTEG